MWVRATRYLNIGVRCSGWLRLRFVLNIQLRSDSLSQSHMSSLGSAGWRSVAWSEASCFILLYDRFLLDGSVIIFDTSVLGGLPKAASKYCILVVSFRINFIDSVIFSTIVAKSILDIMGRVPLRLFFVLSFGLDVRPFPWPYGCPLVPILVLCFCFYKRFQIRVLWKTALGHILLIAVCCEIDHTLIGSLMLFRRHNP